MQGLVDYYDESQTRTRARVKIIDHAGQLFSDKGIESVTMKDIADEAGITVRNLYRYYPSKEYLVVDVAYHLFTTINLSHEICIDPAQSGIEQLQAFMKDVYAMENSHTLGIKVLRFMMYFDLYLDQLDVEHPAYRRYVDLYRQQINDLGYHVMTDILKRGIEDTSIRIDEKDIHDYVVFISQSLLSVIMRTIVKVSENPEINGSLVVKQIDMIINYISLQEKGL